MRTSQLGAPRRLLTRGFRDLAHLVRSRLSGSSVCLPGVRRSGSRGSSEGCFKVPHVSACLTRRGACAAPSGLFALARRCVGESTRFIASALFPVDVHSNTSQTEIALDGLAQ